MRRLRVGLAQINTTVGDLDGNAAKIVEWMDRARTLRVDVVAFPELAVTGYPPEDLLLRRSFVEDNLTALDRIAAATKGIVAIVGFVDQAADLDHLGRPVLYNAAAVLSDGRIAARYHKQLLPNYGVFDEARYFRPGTTSPVYVIAGVSVGINVCEDIWRNEPTRDQSLAGAEAIININASPFHRAKGQYREAMIRERARDNGVAVCYVNAVGGQDELVFDGHSLICDAQGVLVARGAQFKEELIVHDIDAEHEGDAGNGAESPAREGVIAPIVVSSAAASDPKPAIAPSIAVVLDPLAEVWEALVLGVRDYIGKTGFETVVIALSGGIDSSIVAAIAVDALGAEHVVGVSMPSRFSSEGSRTDAQELADRLGMRMMTIPIESTFEVSLDTLSEAFADTQFGTAEENLQARIRGNFLMSLSNKFGWMVLTTGNKSEIATGYSTLYGDMAGGFAVIKDVPKTLVYELSRYRNAVAGRELIPQAVIDKPPTAELRPNQLDTDSLPPYDLLDPILQAYVEEDRTIDEIVAMGFDDGFVRRVVQMVDRNEYKRRQAPPGVKITRRAFGRDRRLPIANRYRPR